LRLGVASLQKQKWLTEGHLREEMVHDVIMRHVVQEETSLPAEKITVDCTGCAALEGPLVLAEVWELGVGVVEICDHDELHGHPAIRIIWGKISPRTRWTYPMRDCEPGYTVVFYNIRGSENRASICNKPGHEEYADI